MKLGHNVLGTCLSIATIVAVVSIYTMQQDPEPALRQVPQPLDLQAKHEPARFGPGRFMVPVAPDQRPATGAVDSDPWVPSGLEVASDKHLVVNKEMRGVFDYFLQPASPGDRSGRLEKLKAYLKAKLPTTAYEEAVPIALTYANYLAAFDALNATEKDSQQTAIPTSPEEIERMTARLTQVIRLRQNILGVVIAQQWFAEEEIGLQQFLARRGQTPKMAFSDSTK